MRKWSSIVSGMALLGTLVLISGCGRVVNRTVERKIREALPGTFGPAQEYRVHVASAMGRTLRGQLSDVTVDGDQVQLKSGLVSLRYFRCRSLSHASSPDVPSQRERQLDRNDCTRS